MDRKDKIKRIGDKIQSEIDKLKKLNCSLDAGIFGIGIIDNTISQKNINDNSDVVYNFNTSLPKNHGK